jgi:ABC-type transport system involved in multi-copper enzyme maturation permease subunit
MNAVLAAARADLRQRTRSFRFLAVLLATVAVALLMLPRSDAGYAVLQLGEARGAYGPAWVGLVFGAVGASILPWLGFFVVKDALARDRSTRVGLLLAASPLGRRGYLAAKLLSNLGVFAAILAACSLMAFVMQWWRGEDSSFHPLPLLLLLWGTALPVLVLVSSVALLFECVPGLRGAFGNIVFFFAWIAVLGSTMKSNEGADGRIVERHADLFGLSAPLAAFEEQLDREHPEHGRGLSLGANIGAKPPIVMRWDGGVDARWLAERFAWAVAGLLPLALAALFFDRFDPARARGATGARAARSDGAEKEQAAAGALRSLTPLPPYRARWRPATLLAAELRLMVWRRRWWWYLPAIGLAIAGASAPLPGAVAWVVPLAWLWAVTTLSEHGARIPVHGTGALLGSAPSPLLRQLPLRWLAGALVLAALASPVLLRLATGGGPGVAAQVLVGAGFVSALALGTAALSGGARLFELLFLMLWYASVQQVPGTGFGGRHGIGFAQSDAPSYLLATFALLLLAAWLGRRPALR